MKELKHESLFVVLGKIKDNRKDKGKRHPLQAILATVCAAMLCGYRSYGAIAEWGRNYGNDLTSLLGYTRKSTPCAATFFNVLKEMDRDEFEAVVGQWASQYIGSGEEESGIAVDGKALRGSKKQGAVGSHILSAVGHRLGVTLHQQSVDEKTNEIPMLIPLLEEILIEDRVITMDALLTQYDIAEYIVGQGGDYVMVVKGNQSSFQEAIQTTFSEPTVLINSEIQTVDIGHGRVEERTLKTSSELNEYRVWPGMKQVFKVKRTITKKKTGKEANETIYGVTSLSPEKADAHRILKLLRGHWTIENRSHWVCDVTFDEDRSQVRTKGVPQLMAAFRNTAISLIRIAGHECIAAACRFYAANPAAALELMGLAKIK